VPPRPDRLSGWQQPTGWSTAAAAAAAQVRQPAVPVRTYTIDAASKDMLPRPGKGLLAKFQEFVIGV
jgi:hypothetical protein